MSESTWTRRRADKRERLSAVAGYVDGKLIEQGRLRDTLEGLLRPGDRVALEGDNQKQADFLSRTLAQCDPGKVNGLHMLISSVSPAGTSRPVRAEDRRKARPRLRRTAERPHRADGRGRQVQHRRHPHLRRAVRADVHRPDAPTSRCCARQGRPRRQPVHRSQHRGHADDRRGRRVSRRRGPRAGQRDRRQRQAARESTSPATGSTSWSQADRPFSLEPLFTRDPRQIGPVEILKAMIAIRGVYERHQVTSLNHGDRIRHGRNRIASAHLRRTTGPEGQDRQALGAEPAPDADPGDRIGLGRIDPQLRRRVGDGAVHRGPARRVLHRTRTDRCGPIGCCVSWPASTRSTCSSAPPCRSTAMRTRRPSPTAGCPGFGGAPNMGHDPHGRRHSSPAWLSLAHGEAPRAARPETGGADRPDLPEAAASPRSSNRSTPSRSARTPACRSPPVMIYGDDVSHVVTEEGVAYLYKAPVAGRPPGGVGGDRRCHADRARRRGARARSNCAATGWSPFLRTSVSTTRLADRSLLAARSIEDLVAWSGGLYDPPAQFQGLVSAMTNTANATQLHRLSAARIADAAVDALRAEATAHPETRAGRHIAAGTATPT